LFLADILFILFVQVKSAPPKKAIKAAVAESLQNGDTEEEESKSAKEVEEPKPDPAPVPTKSKKVKKNLLLI
jgi:hypothetical protein